VSGSTSQTGSGHSHTVTIGGTIGGTDGTHTHAVSGGTIGNTGSGEAFAVVPSYYTVVYIMKVA
ncbi:MAG: hypothetical protein LBK68_00995, partial [Candidatus Margulisbacteria bacterium]|nr:hypothetical protein [Candidatus Margulisiibacteriota bacterium]